MKPLGSFWSRFADIVSNVLYFGGATTLPGMILWLCGLWDWHAWAAWVIAVVACLVNFGFTLAVLITAKEEPPDKAAQPTRQQKAEYYMVLLAPVSAILAFLGLKLVQKLGRP